MEQNVDEGNFFFNKRINLIYGKFLRKLVHKTTSNAKIIDALQKNEDQ